MIIHVTGEHDSGKTTFAFEAAKDPSKICFFDDDIKGSATVKQLMADGIRLGAYHNLTDISSEYPLETNFHVEVGKLLNNIKPGQFETIIFDTWTGFAATCYAIVKNNPEKFRENYAADGRIKGSQFWQEAAKYEASIISELAGKCEKLILITHLKDQYVGQAKVPSKQIPACSKTIEKVCNLRLWLRRNPPFAVPQALVLKRVDKKHFVKGQGLRTVNVLPLKIVPRPDEQSLWDSIDRYWSDPVSSRILDSDEIPDDNELSIISSTMSEDQFRLFRSMVEAGLMQPEEEEIEASTLRKRVEELISKSGMTEQEILEKLQWNANQLKRPTENVVHRLENLLSTRPNSVNKKKEVRK